MIIESFFILPSLTILLGAFVLMLLSHKKDISLSYFNTITLIFLTIALIFEIIIFKIDKSSYLFQALFQHNFILDTFATIFDIMFIMGAILTLLINSDYLKSRTYFKGEYFALLLLSVFGMMMLSHSNELLSAFISLEIASLSIYTLVGFHKTKAISSEAMMKYMILGSMTGAFFILGTTLIYGAVGSTSLEVIAEYVNNNSIEDMGLLIVGASFLLVTIMFKIGAVPFHSWIIDVYYGAPYPITMFMASTFKIAIFAIALRLYIVDFSSINFIWIQMLQTITILTLIGGSFLAISQTKVKRMLAGSSIVHSGYLLIGLSSIGLGSNLGAAAIMFYLIAYFLSAAGSFGILSFIGSQSNKEMSYDDFKGFANRRPYMALFMSIFMLSLAGFPSTIGFLGKFYIFSAAIESGQILLAGLGIVTAFISVYYYFKLIAFMYFYTDTSKQKKFSLNMSTVTIALMATIIIVGGIGTSLISFFPSADTFIEIARLTIYSLK